MSSGVPCDTCGKPVLAGDARYAVADKYDDDGTCVSSRHWTCHVPFEERIAGLKTEARELMGRIRDLDK